MEKIGVNEVEDIASGAAVLGSGGGGDPYLGKIMAINAIKKYGKVRLLDMDEVNDDDLIIPSAMMGAPAVMLEKFPKGDEAVKAFKAIEDAFGREASATISIEAGGLNSTVPIGVAATLRIPMVDCDGMGRAFPEIPMVTPTLYGISAAPMAMADEKGNFVLISTIDNTWMEKFSRAITVEMGGTAVIALYAMRGSELKRATIPGSITLARKIGKSLRTAKESEKDPVDHVLDVSGGFELFRGKASDIKRRTTGRFVEGFTTFSGIDEYRGSELKLSFQNENLIIERDGKLEASVPDLITVLDAETGSPITTERLRYGYRCSIISIPCNEKWRTKDGLKLVGPKAFGYDIEYEPVENLVGD